MAEVLSKIDAEINIMRMEKAEIKRRIASAKIEMKQIREEFIRLVEERNVLLEERKTLIDARNKFIEDRGMTDQWKRFIQESRASENDKDIERH